MLRPERATLEVVKMPDDTWQIGQLKGPANKAVLLSTTEFVKQWLAGYAVSV